MDICGRKVPYVPGVGAQIAGAVPAARVTYSGALQPITSNGHQRRYVELGLAGSERLCPPSEVGPYSLPALHQVGATDAQAASDGGIIPAIYNPPLQQNPVPLCQISEQHATSETLHVFIIPLLAFGMLHC